MNRKPLILSCFFLGLVAACGGGAGDQNGEDAVPEFVVVYTMQDETVMRPLFEAFTRDTGIRIQQVSAEEQRLLQMLRAKHSPPADLIVADSASILWRMADEGLFRPTHADQLDAAVPAALRDPEYLWTGLALKVNAIVFDPSTRDLPVPVSYESLAEPQWKGRVCLSTSSLIENAGWIAHLLDKKGKREAELTVRHLVANLALPVFDDTDSLIQALRSRQCGGGIASLGTALREAAASDPAGIGIVLPAAANGGAQSDIVGAGVSRHAGNPDGARRLLLWLVGREGQAILEGMTFALPLSPSTQRLDDAGLPGSLERSAISVFRLGALYQDAVDLAERAHYP